MTTATKARTSVMDGLKEREEKWSDARAKADELGQEHGTKLKQAQALVDDRRCLIHRDPSLVDHLNVPVGPDNPVGVIDGQIAEVGDLEDLWRKVEHARRIEQSAKQSRDDYVAAHYPELVEAHRTEGEDVASSANEAAKVLVAKLDRYLGVHGKMAGFTVPVPGITTHVVPGLEAAANFKRVAESVDLPAPLPEVS